VRLGTHVSIAGGLLRALDRAEELGAETIQIFASAPQRWAMRPIPPDEAFRFRRRCLELDIRPVFLHALYLINLASPSAVTLQRSVHSLSEYMATAGQLGAAGVVFHTGSHHGLGLDAVFSQLTGALQEVLRGSPRDTWLIIENCAGMGNEIGATFNELGKMATALDDPRIRVCLDTQHAFAAGLDLATAAGLEEVMFDLDKHVGLGRLALVHANDSKVPCGATLDRHENIGEGYIGI
jgi:deoxyribonuclease IV